MLNAVSSANWTKLAAGSKSSPFTVQKCVYCGGENDDGAGNCRECGTELSAARFHQSAVIPTETPPRIDLEKIAGAFTTAGGFSRPSWPVILKALRAYHPPEERLAAWSAVVSQWASRWEAELGKDYWMTNSGSFFLVSALDGETGERILRKANWMAEKVQSFLGPLAWDDRSHLLIVHVNDELLARRFDETVSAPAKTEAEWSAAKCAPVWILICSRDQDVMMHDLESALVWTCLDHLSLPRWLQSGVATQIRRVIELARRGRTGELFDSDLLPEHRRFWNETTIQSFWAGTCEQEYPDQANLFYDLSNILVQLLTEKTKSLIDYLRCAHYRDAGDAAAQVCFKKGLGDLAGIFLGPGHWDPDPLARVECQARVREINSEE